MPEEHVGQLGFDYAWKELLVRARATSEFVQIYYVIVFTPLRAAYAVQDLRF